MQKRRQKKKIGSEGFVDCYQILRFTLSRTLRNFLLRATFFNFIRISPFHDFFKNTLRLPGTIFKQIKCGPALNRPTYDLSFLSKLGGGFHWALIEVF